MTMGDRVAVLKRGVLQQVDSPQNLYDHPDNLFVAGFIGSPAMNMAEGTLEREDGAIRAKLGTMSSLTVPDEAIDKYSKVPDYVGKTVAVGMRPEHFFRPEGSVPDDRKMPQRNVTLVELLGSEVLVHFGTSAPPIITEDMREAIDDEEAFAELEREAKTGGQQFVAKLEPEEAPKLGDKVDIAFDVGKLHFFDLENGAALR
jgi:multiple sugar transport system ATP-binding protein